MQSSCGSPVICRSCALGTAPNGQRPVGQIAWLESPRRIALHSRRRVEGSAAPGTGASSQAPATALVDLLRAIQAGISAGPPPAPAGASPGCPRPDLPPSRQPPQSFCLCLPAESQL